MTTFLLISPLFDRVCNPFTQLTFSLSLSLDLSRSLDLSLFAKGTTEFGRFISRGVVRRRRIASDGTSHLELTLARRYVSDTDWRWSQTLSSDLVDPSDTSPWLAVAAKPPRRPAKRKANDDVGNKATVAKAAWLPAEK